MQWLGVVRKRQWECSRMKENMIACNFQVLFAYFCFCHIRLHPLISQIKGMQEMWTIVICSDS